MARKPYYLVLLLSLIFWTQSCGNDASFDVVVTGPDDLDELEFDGLAIPGPIDPPAIFYSTGPLVFTVLTSGDSPLPVANANVRIDVGQGANVIPLLLGRTGNACYNGSPIPIGRAALVTAYSTLTPADCFGVDTQTDNNGAVQFKLVGEIINGCGAATSDITTFANAQVTASASSASTALPLTIKCAP